MRRISSRENAAVKRLRLLARSGRERREAARTLLDGAHLLAAYLERLGPPMLVAVSESGLQRGENRALLGQLGSVPALVLPDDVFADVSPVDTPTGILAEIAIPPQPEGAIESSCLVLDTVQDAGNVGALLRVAAGAGVRDVLLTPGCAQAWSPRVLRAAMGAHFYLSLRERADVVGLLAHYRGTVFAATLREGRSLYEADLSGAIGWVFGNEGAGLSPALRALAQVAVHIPMAPGVESLNVAAAAAVCLFEQRRRAAHSTLGHEL